MADSLLESFKFFKEGLTQYATQQAVNDAASQVQDLNMQALDEKSRLVANQQIGNQLALRMTSAGAAPQQIAQATDGLVQNANVMGQNTATMERQGNQQEWQTGENQLNRESAERIAGMRASNKNAPQMGKFIKDAQGDFDKLAKGPREQIAFANVAQKALDPKNPILDAAVVNFMARSAGEKGPLTEADKAPFGGSQAYDAKAKQFVEKAKTGRLDDANRAFLKQAVAVFGATGKESIKQFRNQIATRSEKVAQTRGFDLNAQQISDMLLVDDLPEVKNPQIEAGQALLQSMKPGDPRRAKVEEKLKKLMGQ